MLRLNYQYDRNSVRLIIQGLPDLSLGQSAEQIGILSTWKLDLVGYPTLEGNLEHLQILISTITQYTRYYLSGFRKTFGELDGPVQIRPITKGHLIILRSSKENIEPLEVKIDDAELVDLIYCLDSLRYDKRVLVDWNIVINQPKRLKHKLNYFYLITQLSSPILGLLSLVLTIFLFTIIYDPKTEYNYGPKNVGTDKKSLLAN